MQVARERCKGRVVGKPLEQFADVGDPEGPLKSGANFAEALGKIQKWPLNRSRNSSADTPTIRITFLRLFWPDAMVTEERATFKRFARNSTQASLARPSTAGRQRQFQSVSDFTRDCILPSARMDLDREGSAGRSVLNRDHANRLPRRTQRTQRPNLRIFSVSSSWLTLCSFPENCGSYAHTG